REAAGFWLPLFFLAKSCFLAACLSCAYIVSNHAHGGRMPRERGTKERVNLLLERGAIERARRYSERHDTSISSLVSEFLSRLPADESEGSAGNDLTPTVRR